MEDNLLSKELITLIDANAVVEDLFARGDGKRYRDSRVMDIIEFGRIIHAEMSAICDAARNGCCIRDAVMFVTTFPCLFALST
jgi:deoxycytidylate deaminase